jgi:hypothetical protein
LILNEQSLVFVTESGMKATAGNFFLAQVMMQFSLVIVPRAAQSIKTTARGGSVRLAASVHLAIGASQCALSNVRT